MSVTIVNNCRNGVNNIEVMKYFSLFIGLFSVGFLFANVEKKYTQEEYVSTWKSVAIGQMIQYKIPASITMAQGILESGNGNSTLAQQANNHFGIKCHNWTGEKIYIDDDQKGECFRSYSTANESFEDHSKFLAERSRYSSLFSLKTNDYKGWAQGLKDAGYATNPKYPQLLIDLIERLKLNEFDEVGNETVIPTALLANSNAKVIEGQHTVVLHKNKIKYIVAKKGDTFYRISKEFSIGLWQLYKYNDFGVKKDVLEEGDIIYLQPKRRRSKSAETFSVNNPLTLRMISQLEGIKLEPLMDRNNISSPDELLPRGEKIALK